MHTLTKADLISLYPYAVPIFRKVAIIVIAVKETDVFLCQVSC